MTTPGTSEPAQPLPPPVEAGRRILRPNIVPARWRGELQSVLITEAQLRRRVRELAHAITRDHAHADLLVVPILTGTLMFMADLLRHLTMPLRLDFVGVSSYREGTRPAELVFTKELRLEARGRDVLLVDDILDTGNTLAAVQERIRRLKPRRLRTCVLLDKPARRQQPVYVDYVGFEIPNEFVVGYGLDYAERYRNLPFVGVLKPELYTAEPPGR
ncbi:MAG: hypoxanthine phosphoribosyltransferase [Verrucomicrobia bacterium]|nr:MAG: hypoxanthine phosphoribosyltransferase [Verrucomicrobiota bacterium]